MMTYVIKSLLKGRFNGVSPPAYPCTSGNTRDHKLQPQFNNFT